MKNPLDRIVRDPTLYAEFNQLNAPQRVIVLDALLGKPLLITGSGGVGKSRLIHALKLLVPHVTVSASTGVAGMAIHGRTIDSTMGFGLGSDLFSNHQLSRKTIDLIRTYRVLVIDEASMVRVDKIDAIDQRLKHVMGNHLPFGGIQVILVFDALQIPPVLHKNSDEGQQFIRRYGHRLFFFESTSIDWSYFNVHVLDQNMRNTDPEQIQILRNFRMGHHLPAVVEFINDHAQHIHARDMATMTGKPFICRTNAQVQAMNKNTYEALRTPEKVYRGVFKGDYPQTPSELPVDSALQLKVGAQVMILVNNLTDGYINGDIGIIQALHPHQVIVRTQRGTLVVVKPHSWEHFGTPSRHGTPSGSYSQFPLRLAYAFTAHKSQGMTLRHGAIVDYSGWNDFGTTYVMSSRTTDLRDLCLVKPLTVRDILVNPTCVAFTRAISLQALERRPVDLALCDSMIEQAKLQQAEGGETSCQMLSLA